MSTPRDLLMIALAMESDRSPEQGDLSLALARAELIDLLDVQAVRLDVERIVPVRRPAAGDHLLDEAAVSLVGQEPYESVGDWLWRRGRGLYSAYLATLEAEGLVVRRRRWRLLRTGRTMLVDSPAQRAAAQSWASGDAVLVALAAAAGVQGEQTAGSPGITDVAVATVLAAVRDAVTELGLERQRRAIEGDAFDNVWRGV